MSEDVVQVMQHVSFKRGCPKYFKTNNGSKFIANVFDKWAYDNQIAMDFSRPRQAK